MENFTYYNPTKIIFGHNEVEKIGAESANYGTRALILTGKASVKKSGLYDRVIAILKEHQVSTVTYEGIKSNPVYEDADAAVKMAKEQGVDMIIAIGGGSVIDTAKAVAIGYYADHSVWDFYLQKAKPQKALPLLNILTLAATGTEMNSSTVIQDTANGMKRGYGSPLLFPKVSILDPDLTFSVPADYTAYGIADLISHCLEVYFGKGESSLSDHYIASIIKLATEYAPKVLSNPSDYDARANIMWLATNALNGTLTPGKGFGDWGSHGYEHSLSVLYDVAHGAGLSIVFPAWMKHFAPHFEPKLAFLGEQVFGLHSGTSAEKARGFIDKLEAFYRSIHTPVRLKDIGVNEGDRDKILENLQLNGVSGRVYPMNEQDHREILELMW
jgi:alcohol dehydrogenase YqhD (iron-dependent ADH family)